MSRIIVFRVSTSLSDVTYSSGDLTVSSLDTIISGALTFDSSGNIALSADGGNVTMDDGTTTVFDFDVDNVISICDLTDTDSIDSIIDIFKNLPKQIK